MFAGVSLSSLIIKQRSPLFCRLKGFPNLINAGRNNNNKSINSGNMASSVLSYFCRAENTPGCGGGKKKKKKVVWVHACFAVSARKENYRGGDICFNLRVLITRLSVHQQPDCFLHMWRRHRLFAWARAQKQTGDIYKTVRRRSSSRWPRFDLGRASQPQCT